MSAIQFDEGRLMQVLVAPIVSEKATQAAEQSNAVLFKVLRDATKPEIKAAVELMFKVQVKGVSVVNQKGKTKRFGKTVGRQAICSGLVSRCPLCMSRIFAVGFDNISLNFGSGGYVTSGALTSSAFNMSDTSPVQAVEWDETASVGTDITIDVATAPDSGGNPGAWTAWQNATANAGTLLPVLLNGNQWVRYRVNLTGDGTSTPILEEVRINYK